MPHRSVQLSVIIPLRNTREYNRDVSRLETCLHALAAQTALASMEVIVSDFGSGPAYRKRHAESIKHSGLGRKCRHVITETAEPWNISRARNIGLRAARGRYVVSFDADCIAKPDFCEKLLAALTDKNIVHCQVWELPETYAGPFDDWDTMRAVSCQREKHGYGSCQAVERAWAESVHGWDERYVLWGAEDTDFKLRAEQAGREATWLEAEYFHRHHGQENRFEDKGQLAKNRARVGMTKANQLPILRNAAAWGGEPAEAGLASDTCILITTFMRDASLFSCVQTCKKFYPAMAIYVADCGKPTEEKARFVEDYELTLIEAPFDAGVSATRNLGMAAIAPRYKYVVIIEDDISLTPETDLAKWRAVLDHDAGLGVVGGLLRHLVVGSGQGQQQHYEATLELDREARTLHIREVKTPKWKKAGDIRYFEPDIILNVFMFRREIWDAVKWDDRIKSAPEHAHWFLALKEQTPWRVAYAPDVVLEHIKDPFVDTASAYDAFRRRNDGYVFFAETWGIDFIWSSWHTKFGLPNPLDLRAKSEDKSTIMHRNLEAAAKILDRHNCRWWLEAGTCLGAVREQDFIGHDPDIDIGVMATDLPKYEAIRDAFLSRGFELYKEWEHEGRRIELTMSRGGVRVDIFFFYERGPHLWHGAFGFDKSAPGAFGEFLPHVFRRELFTKPREIVFRGLRCYIPNPVEDYLVARYGQDWRTPKPGYLYWNDCKAIDRNFLKDERVVFIGGVWDLFHVGHLNILEKARAIGTKLVAGVLTDEAAKTYRQQPIIGYEDRKRIVESCRHVDATLKQNDKDPTADLAAAGLKPNYIVHGDEWTEIPGADRVKQNGGKAVFLPYTPGIHRGEIKRRIDGAVEIVHETKARKDKIAVVIKTFLRDEVLFRNLGHIAKMMPFPYRLYIADDGHMTPEKEARYARLRMADNVIVNLPFNSGISHGRNSAVKVVTEDYVLILDDDTSVVDADSLKNMKAVLDADPEVGLVSALLKREGGAWYGPESYSKGLRLERREQLIVRLPVSGPMLKAGDISYRYADQVPNVFLAKREIFDEVRWDDRIKVEYEHMDFFLGLQKTRWKAAVCFNAEAVHYISIPCSEYSRARHTAPQAYFYAKHGIGNISSQF